MSFPLAIRLIHRYAVVATESDVSDFTAIFDDEGQAEAYAKQISGDLDFDGCDYAVVRVEMDANAIHPESEDVRHEQVSSNWRYGTV